MDLTPWFDMTTLPRYRGMYEVRRSNGRQMLAKFRDGQWFDSANDDLLSVKKLTAWRGCEGRLAKDVVDGLTNDPDLWRRPDDVRLLFRHWASLENLVQACAWYVIGIRLGLLFDFPERDAYQRLIDQLTPMAALTINRQIDDFLKRADF